jgi:uncharacterized DUF497 family protein
MEDCRIVWDENKNAENRRKHGIGFETARFVFADPERLWRIDRSEGNTSGEERWQSLGMAESVVFVVYTEREAEGVNETRLMKYLGASPSKPACRYLRLRGNLLYSPPRTGKRVLESIPRFEDRFTTFPAVMN